MHGLDDGFQEKVSLQVRRALAEVSRLACPEDIRPSMSLIDDLAIDSVKLIELTVALEDSLGVDECPLREWLDASDADTSAYTVATLVANCVRLCQAEVDTPSRV